MLLPSRQQALDTFLHKLFPAFDLSGLAVRTVVPTGGPAVTIIYIQHLIDPADLERLVLTPLSRGPANGSPAEIAASGRFPAPTLQVATDAEALQKGLYAGLAALHFDGHAAALLVGSPQTNRTLSAFGSGTDNNVAVLYRHLPTADLRVVRIAHNRTAVVYLQSQAAPDVVQAAVDFAGQLGTMPPKMAWWRAMLDILRLPKVLECPQPTAAAAALKLGYVAILTDHHPLPLLAPTTLELLLSGPRDVTLPTAVQRLVVWPRVVAASAGLLIGAMLIAITSYHHTLLPGPFLVALAATRQNAPLPIVLEIALVAALSDAAQAAACRFGGQRILFLAWMGAVIAIMGSMQVGVIGAMSGMASISSMIIRDVLPNPALPRMLRIWQYIFMVAGAGLGVYGITLLVFALLVYLGEERILTNPIRLSPGAVTQ